MAKRAPDTLHPLAESQALAASPGAQVRLNASAGTGKTQVLAARVMRLLLGGASPESILCLTFTKAGAAEMAERIHERLGHWVTASDALLAIDLKALGEDFSAKALQRARKLFARVLDARGSGLRIQTIHGFAQELLTAFPVEAMLPPGFRPAEEREQAEIAAAALAELVDRAGREGRLGLLDRLKALVLRLGEDKARAFLLRCAAAPDAFEALGPGIEAQVSAWLTNGMVDISRTLELACNDEAFDRRALELVRQANANWLTKAGAASKNGTEASQRIADWLVLPPGERVARLDDLRLAWRTGKGEWRKSEPDAPGYRGAVELLDGWLARLIELKAAAELAPALAAALELGQEYVRIYSELKRAKGVADFNDLIRHTTRLLNMPGIGEWVRFKLDQAIDHILVDEAQDTNDAQWDIVRGLADEFFAGAGAKDDRIRTLFLVGDLKQAIFGFQGTDPASFDRAAAGFAQSAAAAGQAWLDLPLSTSYRSSQPILDLVDAAIDALGHEAMGLGAAAHPHRSSTPGQSGRIELFAPVTGAGDGEEDEDEAAEEGWIDDAQLKWADMLAARVAHWTNGGLRLRNQDRDCQPGDVMILLKKRGELARLIVSRLIERKVEVAGIDRLLLSTPLAVQDLLACIRFALQPEDDLSLACLLVSPLVGWSQDALYDHARDRQRVSLWAHLGEAKPPELLHLLAIADMATPHRFLEEVLSGRIGGRRKLIARLGEAARDPVNELLNAALAFEAQATPSLQGFLHWFERGEAEVKRDPAKPENKVRVLTAHSAKGLQAPVVVLADAAIDPALNRQDFVDWHTGSGPVLPVFRPGKDQRPGSLGRSIEAADRREMEEHWRLLYVAMTRAEEHLFVGGALKATQRKALLDGKGLTANCWHARIERALKHLGAETQGSSLVLQRDAKPGRHRDPWGVRAGAARALPGWALEPAPRESRPPRPLAPSALGVADLAASPPPDDSQRAAARRGVLLHALFERLPAVAPAQRRTAALRWLEHSAGVGTPEVRTELADAALAVIEAPGFAHLFGPEALAEAPLAGVVGGQVVSGSVDRLLVTDDEVQVIDFKTGRRVPRDAGAVPDHHAAQMAAYAALLAAIFPGRRVRAALLYTAGPRLIELAPGFETGWLDRIEAQSVV